MTSYLLPLLAIVALCAFWALFQQWLAQMWAQKDDQIGVILEQEPGRTNQIER